MGRFGIEGISHVNVLLANGIVGLLVNIYQSVEEIKYTMLSIISVLVPLEWFGFKKNISVEIQVVQLK